MFNIPTVTVAKTTLTGTSSSVTLTYVAPSVAWTPRHLLLRVNGRTTRGTTNAHVEIRLNGDDGSNYSSQFLNAEGTTTAAAISTDKDYLWRCFVPGTSVASAAFGGGECLITDALSTRTFKAFLGQAATVEAYLQLEAGRWENTAAITSVTFLADANQMAIGTTLELCVVDESFNIDEQILGSDAKITVSSIGASNGDLVVIGNLRTDRAVHAEDNAEFVLNADATDSNYDIQIVQGVNGTTVGASHQDAAWYVFSRMPSSASPTSVFGAGVAQIANFSDGANDRVINALAGHYSTATKCCVTTSTSRWNNTAAITSVLVQPSDSTNFKAGSMLSTYVVPKNLIARQELGSAAGITFSDIPQTYDHLEVSCYVRDDRSNSSDSLLITLNDDTTAANYDRQTLYGSGTDVTAGTSAADNTIGNIPSATHTANVFGVTTVTIYNYTKTDRHKHFLSVSGEDAFQYVGIDSLRWENTAAITKILVNGGNGNLAAGSVIELRGISADTTAAAPSNIEKLNGIASADIEAVN